MDKIAFLRQQVSDLNNENLQLKSSVAFLEGKIEAYEWFLKMKGFIKGDEE